MKRVFPIVEYASLYHCTYDRRVIEMRRIVLFLLLAGLVGGAASAQIWMDAFNYPNGTNLGSWKELTGDWKATNNLAEAEVKFSWQYLVQPNRVYKDCVAQVLVMHNNGANHTLQFGGIALRCPSSGTNVMVKVQNNNYSVNQTKFDCIWLYEHPGGSTNSLNLTPFAKAQVRLIVLDQKAIAQVDSDLDGIWNYQVTRTLTSAPQPGPVGIDGFGGVHVDDFILFDGVIVDKPGNPKPTPGSGLLFDLRGTPSKFYQAASSLGNTGIPLFDGRVIPLSADNLFLLSVTNVAPFIFANYSGLLDPSGNGFVKVNLPAIPALVGVTFYTAFVTYDATGVVNISNDHQVTIIS